MEIRNLDGDMIARGADAKAIVKAETSGRVPPHKRKSFQRANLRNLDLEGAEFCASNATHTARRSDFMGSDFSGAILKGARFSGLDLRGCDFTDCDMRDVSMVTCDLTGARFDNVDMGGFTDEQRTGRSTWIQNCVFDDVRATGSDFQEAMLSAISADGAVFHGCKFEDANFNGDWDDATFALCDLEDATPGNHGGGEGARFGVQVCDCCLIDLYLEGCPTVPITGTKCDFSDETWAAGVFDSSNKDDYFDCRYNAVQAEKRTRQNAYIALYMAKLAKQNEAARLVREQARVEQEEKTRIVRGQILADQRRRDAVDRRRARAAAPKVAALSPLSASFVAKPVAFEGGIHRVRIHFNRALRVGWRTVRDQGFVVTGGSIVRVRRIKGRSDFWELSVRPAGVGQITISTTESLIGTAGQSLATAVTVTFAG